MIILIVGLPGSGKTTLQKELLKFNNYSILKEVTNRPKRDGEGDDYVYSMNITEDSKRFVHVTKYTIYNGDVYYYGVLKSSIAFSMTLPTTNHVLVTNVATVKELFKQYGRENFFLVYLDLEPDFCADRMHQRDGIGQEVSRRIKDDGFDLSRFFLEEKPDYHISKEYPVDELARGIDYTISYNLRKAQECK